MGNDLATCFVYFTMLCSAFQIIQFRCRDTHFFCCKQLFLEKNLTLLQLSVTGFCQIRGRQHALKWPNDAKIRKINYMSEYDEIKTKREYRYLTKRQSKFWDFVTVFGAVQSVIYTFSLLYQLRPVLLICPHKVWFEFLCFPAKVYQ